MTASLPADVQQVFERFVTTELTTVDAYGQPITWPVTPYYKPGAGAIDLTTGIGYPKKADDAARNPHVSLLFSDPTGSGIENPCAVLVQGSAHVDDTNLESNRERYLRESVEKLPATKAMHPPGFIRGLFDWYYLRLYIYVRPERVFVWPEGDFCRRSRRSTTPAWTRFARSTRWSRRSPSRSPRADRPPGTTAWTSSAGGTRTAVVSVVGPDGFPLSSRVQIEPERAAAARAARRPARMDAGGARPGSASRRTSTIPSSGGRPTSRSAGTSRAMTTAGRSSRTSSWAGSSSPSRSCSPTATTSAR